MIKVWYLVTEDTARSAAGSSVPAATAGSRAPANAGRCEGCRHEDAIP
jgi:hypothetical protein